MIRETVRTEEQLGHEVIRELVADARLDADGYGEAGERG